MVATPRAPSRQRSKLLVDRLQAQHDLFLHRIGAHLSRSAPRGKVGDRPLAGRLGIGIHCTAYLAQRDAAAYKRPR